MSSIANYLFGVIGVCVIASIARLLLSGSKHYKTLGNTIVGVFLILSVLSAVVEIDWSADNKLLMNYTADYNRISEEADAYQAQALRERIKQQTQAYIWNKAKELGLNVEIEVRLSETYPYAPCGINILGHVSPYAKSQLSSYLSSELGIPKEAQVWMSADG